MTFAFEDLIVYQKSLDWVCQSNALLSKLHGKTDSRLMDQLTRATLSIPLNIAEGNGRWHKAEKRNFFWIARGSTFECVALIQVMKRQALLSEPDYSTAYDTLEQISKMLTSLVQAFKSP